ncbi:hypothetical protein F5Y06DRAFT_99152 [Hypoxylon sp. FL0890]|nr:hypothetical protein F5Y06DRAFT_99152 [Hypoxylon sp. FL0890]
MLIADGQDPNISIDISKSMIVRFRPGRQKKNAVHLTKTAALARCLLQHGAPVHEPDASGNGPLDCVLDYWSTKYRLFRKREGVKWRLLIYQNARVLVEHGAIAKTASSEILELRLPDFQAQGLDTTALRECLDRIQSEKNKRNTGERAANLVALLWR